MTRQDGRAYDELRPIKITTDFVKFPEGSCLIECGDTKVLCCASIEDKTPPHVAEGEGWVTAEYSMLPRANRERSKRDISKLKLSPRSAEIQRLVGRSLRAAVDLAKLADLTKNFTGAELEGLVKSASSFALEREVDINNLSKVNMDPEKMNTVTRDIS